MEKLIVFITSPSWACPFLRERGPFAEQKRERVYLNRISA
jgi:hypothetical protein